VKPLIHYSVTGKYPVLLIEKYLKNLKKYEHDKERVFI
jgi:hypothetical protein